MPPKDRPYQLLMPDETGKRKHVGYYASKLEREIAKQHLEVQGKGYAQVHMNKRTGQCYITVDHLIGRSVNGNDGYMIRFKVTADTPEQVIHTMRDAMNVIDHCYPDERMTDEYLPDGVQVIRGNKAAQDWRLYRNKRTTVKPGAYNRNEHQQTVYYRELPQRLIEKEKNEVARDILPKWYELYERQKKPESDKLPAWLLPNNTN